MSRQQTENLITTLSAPSPNLFKYLDLDMDLDLKMQSDFYPPLYQDVDTHLNLCKLTWMNFKKIQRAKTDEYQKILGVSDMTG